MDICIFGAGAVGGYLAGRLARAGTHRVSVVARGAHLAAIRADGLRIRMPDESFVIRPHAAIDPDGDLPPQDVVIVTLKAPSLPGAAAAIARRLKPDGSVVILGNGIPFWWNQGLPGRAGTLPLLDPDGVLGSTFEQAQVIGGVVYSANEVLAPGVVQHTLGNRWIFGQPDGHASPRVDALVAALAEAGLAAEAATDIRHDIFTKLLRNASQNTVCALTRLPAGLVSRDPALVGLGNALIDEIVAIAGAGGWDVAAAGARNHMVHTPEAEPGIRPSMLQDAIGGRGLEVEAILGQPQIFAREAGLATPAIDIVLTLLRGLDASSRAA